MIHRISTILLLVGTYLTAQVATDGTVNSYQKISDIQGNFTAILDDADWLGTSVAGLGDMDGDGVPDLAIGAYRDDDGGTDRGAVYVLFMNASGTVKSYQKISDTAGNFTDVLDDNDRLGSSVVGLGDIDGDSVPDLAIGAAYDSDGGPNRGAVYILFMNASGTVKSTQKISDTVGNFTATLDDADFFGFSVAWLGDMDGDSVPDIAIGASSDDDGGGDRGAVYILFMNASGTVKSYQKISDTQGNFTAILDDSDQFGSSVTGLGDMDGDSVPDLAVSAVGDDDGGGLRGSAYVLFLNANGTVKSYQKISDTQGNFTAVLDDFDQFGSSVAGLGDMDGDDVPDLAIGASHDDDDGTDRGAVYVLFMNASGTVKSYQKISDSDGNFTAVLDDSDWFGFSVARLGDLEGNGLADLAVGVAYDDDGGADRGAVYVLFLNNAPPTAPTSLAAAPSDQQVTLAWSANSEADLAKYKLYRNTTSDTATAAWLADIFQPTTSYNDLATVNFTTYYYWLTAVDSADNEGGFSDIANGTPVDQTTTMASVGNETKFIVGDAAESDNFGIASAISGDYAIVGAHALDHSGLTNAGAAYIFVRNDPTWTLQAKLTASDADSLDVFGYPVAISGDYAIVGAYKDDHSGLADAGSAYIFERSGSSWIQQAKLTASDADTSDWFGTVAIGGDYAVVGARRDDHSGLTDAGAVYIFLRNGTIWTQQAKLTAADAAAGDFFGDRVAINGYDVIIGANGDDSIRGSAYIFVRSGITWSQQEKITASDATVSAHFGHAVAIDGDNAVVGAYAADPSGISDAGAAYVYSREGTSWSQQAQLIASDAAEGEQFGISVTISGNYAIVGARQNAHSGLTTAGAAYIYEHYDASWGQQVKLTASDAAAFDALGQSVALSGDYVVVSAEHDDHSSVTDAGAAYVYNLPPYTPADLTATPSDQQIDLTWSANSEPDLAKYRIYRDTSSPAFTLIDSVVGSSPPDTTYTDTSLVNGTTYYFLITSVDSAGNESGYSNEVSATPVGLVAFYPFNNNANDESANSNDGIVNGSAITTDRFGNANSAYSFDGVNDYIDVTDHQSLESDRFTVSTWVNCDSELTNGIVVDKRLGTNTDYYSNYKLLVRPATSLTQIEFGTGTAGINASWAYVPAAAVWHLLSGTYDGSEIKLYVDTTLSASFNTNQTPYTPTDNLTIGRSNGATLERYFKGFIDDIRIYNRALTAAEITTLYEEGGWNPASVISTTPTQNALNVAQNSTIAVTFDEDMDGTSIDANTMVVRGNYTGLIAGSYGYDAPSKTATFTPTAQLKVGEQVDITLTNGISTTIGAPLARPYLWSFTVQVLGGSGIFANQLTYAAGDLPYSVATVDLDQDGNLDLITANGISDNISVLLGNGDGSFVAQVLYAAGDNPNFVSAADLDGDGYLDLVTTNSNSNNVSVLLGVGDGTFASQSNFATTSGPSAVFIADLNGDGKMDLATANVSSNNLSVLLGIGDGTFMSQTSLAVGTGPHSVHAADLDNDGDLDLITDNSGADNISVLLGDGDGTFANQVLYSVSGGPRAVYASDLDSDGNLDLAVTDYTSNTVSILLNNGDGTFANRIAYGTGDGPYTIKFADLDADGKLDMVVATIWSNTVSVHHGNGDGTFATHISYSTSIRPHSVCTADLDNDGDLDIITANADSDNLSVFLNTGDLTPPAAPSVLTAIPGDGQIDLHWNPNSEADLAKYRIYRGTSSPASTLLDSVVGSSPPDTTYTDTSLTNGQEYFYRITAVDSTGNASGYSNEVSETPEDITAPAAPNALTATPSDQQIDLTWDANGEADLADYYLYRYTANDSTLAARIDTIPKASTNATDTGLSNGSPYWYWVSAVDSASNESVYSTGVSSTPNPTPFQTDSLALVALYDSTDGANWTTTWTLANPVNTWYGITVSGNRVTQIILPSNNLSGTIPTTIGNLTGLTNLRLLNNSLAGTIPDTIGNLTNLTHLYLYDNQLSGTIPVSIGNLTSLESLYLYQNLLSGSIPSTIGNLASMRILELNQNQLSGPVPTEITNLQVMEYLFLNDNLLTSVPDLNGIATLHTLQIQNNRLTFDDIEPNINVASTTFTYTPQDSLGVEQDTTVVYGAGITLSISAGGTLANNTYLWRKNGSQVASITGDSAYTISSITAGDAGAYTCDITNSTAPALTLICRPINVSVIDLPPAAPSNLAATPGNRQVILTWSPSAEADLSHYWLYRNVANDSLAAARIDTLAKTDIGTTDTGLTNGITYWYWLSAIDSASNESILSLGASAMPVNYPPVITSQDTASAIEDTYFSYTAAATDPEDSTLTIVIDLLPSWLSWQAKTDSTFGTPLEGTVDTSFRVIAFDGELTDTLIVDVTVTPMNDPPVITSLATASATEDTWFSYHATATDPEDSTITFTFDLLPSWLDAEADSVYGTPLEGAMDTSFRVIASDSELTDTLMVALTVTPVNDPPMITSLAAVNATEDVYLSYHATAIDPEYNNIDWTFDQLPSWLDADVDSVYGTPLEGKVDTSFMVIASDSELTDTLVVTVTITPVNDPPVASSPAAVNATEDEYIVYRATIDDPDGPEEDWGFDKLPAWLVADADSVFGTPLEGTIDTSFRLIVFDGALRDTLIVSVTVTPVNDPPVITSAGTVNATEDVYLSYHAAAIDPEYNNIDWTFDQLPSWLDADVDSVFGTPREGSIDTSFTVIVNDGDLADTLEVTLMVTPINDAPVVTSPLVMDVVEGEYAVYRGSADDPEDSTLTWTFADVPVWLYSQSDSAWGIPDEDAVNTMFRAIVSDGDLTDTAEVVISITKLWPSILVGITNSDFGFVPRDTTRSKYATVHNTGLDTLIVTNMTLGLPEFAVRETAFEVVPGDSHQVWIDFTPADPIAYKDTLRIFSDDPDNVQVNIAVSGSGSKPVLTVTQEIIDFGDSFTSYDTTKTIVVQNDGNASLHISSITSNNSVFTILAPNGPEDIAGGAGLASGLVIQFSPPDTLDYSGLVIIASSDPDTPLDSLEVFGKGVKPYLRLKHYNKSVVAANGGSTNFGFIIYNDGNYPMDFEVIGEDGIPAFNWLMPSPAGGTIASHSELDIIVNTNDSQFMLTGNYWGSLQINCWASGETNVHNAADTIKVHLNILSAAAVAFGSDVIVAGNADPVVLTSGSGEPLGLTLNFHLGNGGTISAIAADVPPPTSDSTSVLDPDGSIEEFATADLYWEISADIEGAYAVDVTFDYSGLLGVPNPQGLRLGRRAGFAGANEPWGLVEGASTLVDEIAQTISAVGQDQFSQWTIIADPDENPLADVLGPTISNINVQAPAPTVGNPATVAAQIVDESTVATTQIYYAKGEDQQFTAVSMVSGTDDNYTGNIPQSAVTHTGVVYFVKAVDDLEHATLSDTNQLSISYPANTLTTGVQGSAFPNGLSKSAWRLFSSPGILDETDNTVVLDDDFESAASNETWQLFKYDGEYSITNEVQIGQSYWIKQVVTDNVVIDLPGGSVADLNGFTYAIPSHTWKFIASPYSFTATLDVDDEVFYGPFTYGPFGGGGQEGWSTAAASTPLAPFGGYVIYNLSETEQILALDPGAGLSQLAKRTPAKIDGWRLAITAEGQRFFDGGNVIGRSSVASEGFDQFDYPEMPNLVEHLSLALHTDLEAEHPLVLNSDIRSDDVANGVWHLNLSSNGDPGDVRISKYLTGELPPENQILLLDLGSREVHDLLALQSPVTIKRSKEQFPARLELIVGDAAFTHATIQDILATLPTEFALGKNYPNPFNPTTTIEYALPRPAKVSLRVYDLLGKEVATLLNEWQDMGYRQVKWHGRDQGGRSVASGIYFVVYKAEDVMKVRKILLLK
ncbi:FG-GAP-like repeat-containing protein [Candidatus Neomarinimicrobiota bacterium]